MMTARATAQSSAISPTRRSDSSTGAQPDRRRNETSAKPGRGGGEKILDLDVASHQPPAFLFDLDGTLVDSVYQHVIAWRDALEGVGISLPVWKIHRRIGMSGGLFVNALARELDTELDREVIAALPGLHADAFIRRLTAFERCLAPPNCSRP